MSPAGCGADGSWTLCESQAEHVDDVVVKHRVILAAGLALVLSLGGPGAGQAQTGLADSITDDSGVAGLNLTVSESIDFAAQGVVAPEGEELPSGWLKAFVLDPDTVSIIAVEHPSVDALRAGLAGVMADIDREDRQLHAALDGVVVGDIQQQGRAVRYALYGEAHTSFTIAASGPNREQLAERVLLAQVEHSAGDRFPLRADENERYLDGRDAGRGTDVAYNLGRFAVWGLLAAGLLFLVRKLRKRGDEANPPDPV